LLFFLLFGVQLASLAMTVWLCALMGFVSQNVYIPRKEHRELNLMLEKDGSDES